MAIPFKVFDGQFRHDGSTGYVWCVRCEDWIPVEVAWGRTFDPHVKDHLEVYRAIREVAVKVRSING